MQVANLASVPADARASHYDLEAFRKATRECWNQAVTPNPEYTSTTVTFEGVDPGTMSDEDCAGLVQTQLILDDAYESVRACAPQSIRAARRFPRGTPQSALLYLNGTIERMDAIRILMARIPEFVSETLTELGASNQRIVMLLMAVQTSNASEEEKQAEIEAMNKVLEQDMRAIEARLSDLSQRADDELSTHADTIDDLLGTYPFLNLN